MKQPIKPEDIRKGDLIRYEPGSNYDGQLVAQEYRAQRDGQAYLPGSLGGTHYLLDRPKPKVDLPTEPTLGWLSADLRVGSGPGDTPNRRLAFWHRAADPEQSIQWNGGDCGIARDWVTAFTPAVAVPKAALDELRRKHEFEVPDKCIYVTDFLAAVDEANGAD